MENTPKVYVGTWRKYNNGNLDGAWIDLAKCGTYEGFIAKCRETHKDEDDPEFMIQDYECFPEGLDPSEWLGRKDFDDVLSAMENEEQSDAACRIVDYSEKAIAVIGDTKAIKDKLKELGGKFNSRLSCGAGWIFSKKMTDKVSELVKCGTMPENTLKTDKYAAALADYIEKHCVSLGRKEYVRKNYAAVVPVRESFYIINKPSIETKFCFRDEGPDYEFYKRLSSDEGLLREHFISENLRRLREFDKERPVYVDFSDNMEECYLYREMPTWNWKSMDMLTPDEIEEVNGAIRFVRDGFKKRLETYLKRYGVSKLHIWTYWEDR